MDTYLRDVYRQWDARLADISEHIDTAERSSPDPMPATPTHSSELSECAYPRRTRQNLPPATIRVLKKWLFAHCDNPYPGEREKDALATQANISTTQLNNWFINARRRSLKRSLNDGHRSFTITDHSANCYI